MIGPLLRVAASAAATRSLRAAVQQTLERALLTVGAALAVGVSALCLSLSAYALIERELDPASAYAIVGAFWGMLGLGYFVVAKRRRRI